LTFDPARQEGARAPVGRRGSEGRDRRLQRGASSGREGELQAALGRDRWAAGEEAPLHGTRGKPPNARVGALSLQAREKETEGGIWVPPRIGA
jgi:hypothetical protein